jgi:AcrR family transcriptional regulator
VPFPAKTNTDAILASATDIISSGGLSSLSMRTLAGRLGVRASSLYRHFPDRASIEKALANRASEQLLLRMRQTVEGLQGERAVFAAARAYLDFATSESPFYDMMMESVAADSQSFESTKQIWDFFVRLISNTTNLGDDTAGAAAFWSFLHGFTVLARSGQLGESSAKLTFARGTQALVRGLSVPDAEAVRSPS